MLIAQDSYSLVKKVNCAEANIFKGDLMSKRYGRSLQEQVKIVQEHTFRLVKNLDFQVRETSRLFRKYNFKTGDTYPQDVILRYKRMKEIRNELECVKEYVFLQWPNLKELFEQLDKVEIHEDKIQTVEAKWEKVSEAGETVSVQ